MRLTGVVWSAAVVVGICTVSTQSRATTEGPAFFDGRSVGMGSTGVAYTDNGSAPYHNPATMHQIETFAVTADISPVVPIFTAPLRGPSTEVESESTIAPFFLVGGAYRLSEQLVIGLGFFGAGGFGADYKDFGKIVLGQLELAPAVSYALTKEFSVGLEYRISYALQESDVPADPANPALRAKTEMSGISFLGAHVGVYYRPIEPLRLGASYRSKVTTDLEGDLTTPFGTVGIKSEFSSPHQFKVGAAYQLIEKMLLLVLDVRYLLHSEANKELVIESTEGPPLRQVQRLDWENAVVAGIGAEFMATETVPLRVGYSLTKSATPKDGPSPFFLPPGLVHTAHVGAGLRLSTLDIDLGAFYAHGGEDVAANPGRPDVFPGHYGVDIYAAALSVTYHQ
jgi:long-chain fatty acid transport protein